MFKTKILHKQEMRASHLETLKKKEKKHCLLDPNKAEKSDKAMLRIRQAC